MSTSALSVSDHIDRLTPRIHAIAKAKATDCVEADDIFQHIIEELLEKSRIEPGYFDAREPYTQDNRDAFVTNAATWAASEYVRAMHRQGGTYDFHTRRSLKRVQVHSQSSNRFEIEDDVDIDYAIDIAAANPEQATIQSELIKEILDALSEEEQIVAVMTFTGHGVAEIGQEMGYSRPRVSQVRKNIRTKAKRVYMQF